MGCSLEIPFDFGVLGCWDTAGRNTDRNQRDYCPVYWCQGFFYNLARRLFSLINKNSVCHSFLNMGHSDKQRQLYGFRGGRLFRVGTDQPSVFASRPGSAAMERYNRS